MTTFDEHRRQSVIALTGGSSGIGAAVMARLLAKGCDLYNLDLEQANLPGVTDIGCDLADPASIDQAITRLPGQIDALINVAGVAPGQTPPEVIFAVNFLGMRHLIENTLARIMDEGNIVIVASSAGRDWPTRTDVVNQVLDTGSFAQGESWLNTHLDVWFDESYRFSKQCAAAYTHRATNLGRERRIRVNCVNPGIVATRLAPEFRTMLGPERFDRIVELSGRPGTPEDVAEVVDFLATGECRWLNGVELTVDGGYHSGIVGGWIEAV